MCGICGKLSFDAGAGVERTTMRAMLDTIRHRGPDDEGIFLDSQVGLGHRRLSIIDLSSGHQPLSNEDGTVWIVFNGEIYNYRELRPLLLEKGHVFKTQSDTEVIVHLYEELGVGCVEKLRGMFAFAIWDQKAKTLFLARDRVGIKPLYYSVTRDSLVFASEIKAILADPAIRSGVSPQAIDRFLTFLYSPGAETLFNNVVKLPPGSYLLARDGHTVVREYWDLHFTDASAHLSVKQSEDQLLALLSEAVAQHMIADVPVGILLSGGVDSTAMLSYAVENTDQPISSYTIGFSDPGIIADERPYARLAAQAFGANHHEMTISAADFLDFMPRYVWHMEEPVCEPPAVALYYVSQLARRDVKVLISGEGGDEAFAGYSNYRNLLWLERVKRWVRPLNGFTGKGLAALNSVVRSQRIAKYVPLMDAHWPDYYYTRVSFPYRFFNRETKSLYSPEFAAQVDKQRSLEPLRQFFSNAKNYGMLNQMLYVDTKTWLPDDLLIKADRMTMANSVELRVPLLDHKLLEFAASLPSNYKVRNFTTKFIAKRALAGRVPKTILERRKAGFPVPYERWLRKDLRDWVQDILFDSKTLARGYFARKAVEDLVARDQREGGYSKEIFSLATLELWHRAFA
jgi:asparagine synthase (glutamine-hydrolysing)